jgi:hypothetical protein
VEVEHDVDRRVPSTVISAVGTPPSSAAVTVTIGGQRLRVREPLQQPPLLADAAAHRQGRLSQARFELLSLLGTHRTSPCRSVGLVAFRLRASQVSGHHRDPVMTAHLTGGDSQGADGITKKGDRHV